MGTPKPVIKANCANPGKPTICDSRLRTMNIHAECGSPEDIYQLSPWRAPGSAPVIDACGALVAVSQGRETKTQNKLLGHPSRIHQWPSWETWAANSHQCPHRQLGKLAPTLRWAGP